MGWTEVAAGIGTNTAIAGLKAAKAQMNKRQYKRLLATAVAQILELHPDIGSKKARRRARRLTGARPSKKLMRPIEGMDWKAGAEGAAVAAATAGVAKVAGVFGAKLKEKLGADEDEESAGEPQERVEHEDSGAYGHSGVRH
jgi:hypothetical protein